MINMLISREELLLLEDIRDLAFGEIYLATTSNDATLHSRQATQKEAGFIHALREYKKIEKIIVHEGEPTSAEVVTKTPRGRICLKKIRF